jgi:hypothetical protein
MLSSVSKAHRWAHGSAANQPRPRFLRICLRLCAYQQQFRSLALPDLVSRAVSRSLLVIRGRRSYTQALFL